MSYPHIMYKGYKISLIEPFTVDDKLITKIEMNDYDNSWYLTDYSRNGYEIRLQLNYEEYIAFSLSNVDFNDERINEQIKDIYLNYINSQYTNEYIVRECRHMLNVNTYQSIISHLLSDIDRQCGRCNSYSMSTYMYSTIDVIQDTLIRQGRPRLSTYNGFSTGRVNDFAADTCITFHNNGYVINPYYDYFHRNTEKSKIIHTHSYTPKYKSHYVSEENEATTLLLGAEIEVDNGGKSEEHARKVLEIMNGQDTWDSEENIYCVHDGSLSNGLEFPTQPGSLAWHSTLPYKEMFEYLDKNGYKAHDTKTCGLHIHINRSFFGKKESECIGKLIYIVEKFNDEFSILGRRNCRYAKLLGYNGEKCKELYQKGSQIRDKYNAINLLHKDTIEIRSFKGTLRYSTFMNTLEFVSDLALYVKNHTEEEIENMEWSDLYNTFSSKLKKYYDERKKIESEKKKEEKKEPEDYIMTNADSISFGSGGLYINEDLIASVYDSINLPTGIGFRQGIGVNLISPNAIRGLRIITSTYDEILDNSNSDAIIDTLNNIYTGYVLPTNFESEILRETNETNEKKLKRLKKQLKTEQNYITKKELRKQINELQKAIKQEKKRKKKQNNVTN